MDKYSQIFNENKFHDYFNFQELHNDIKDCSYNCEEIYRRVHQEKSSEISYVNNFYKKLSFEKHINKCKSSYLNEPEKLLNSYNYKLGNISKRFGSY